MAMPALVLEMETPVEERIARLESDADRTRSDIADIKIDLRRLNDKLEQWASMLRSAGCRGYRYRRPTKQARMLNSWCAADECGYTLFVLLSWCTNWARPIVP